MTIKSLRVLTALFFVLVTAVSAVGQSDYKSEKDMLKQAERIYGSGDFASAMPLYAQAVSNNPQSSEYNYRLGVCIVEASRDKEDAVRFLEMAKLSPQTDADVDYYLGVALHHASRFDESVVALEKFVKSGARRDKVKSAKTYIQFSNNALEAQSDLSADRNDIIGHKETTPSGMPGLYTFNADAGRIMKAPADLRDKNCKGALGCDYFFLAKGGSTLILARDMGKERGYDLFKMVKSRSGKWSEPIDLGPKINTAADEAYATLSPDGKTLYFSSNGSRSTGGFDLFRSELITGTNQWDTPSSMGFPVNSPGDDIFYMIAADGKKAYFSSDRATEKGKYNVYEAAVTRDNRRFFAIEGSFICDQCLDNTSASITVVDPETMGAVAHFRTVPGKGSYRMKLYVPGDFIYQVEADGFSFAQSLASLEERGKGRVFQEAILRRDGSGSEKLVITNKYDEDVAGAPVAEITENPEPAVQETVVEPIAAETTETATATTAAIIEPIVYNENINNYNSNNKSESHKVEVEGNIAASKSTMQPVQQETEPVAAAPLSRQQAPEKVAEVAPEPVAENSTEPAVTANNETPTTPAIEQVQEVVAEAPSSENTPAADEAAPAPVTEAVADIQEEAAPAKMEAAVQSDVTVQPTAPVAETTAVLPVPVFRIQLGAYYSTTEKELRNRLKDKLPGDAEFVKNDKGYIQVISGNLPDYESAKFLKEQLIAQGFTGAFVVVFANDHQAVLADYVAPEPEQ